MAKIKRLKDKNGNMHTIGDADVSAYESTLSGATTNVPYSSAVKAAIDAAAGDAATALTNHKNDQTNPHKVTKSQIGLGNVENKSSATIRGEITSANVTNALGYTPMDSAKAGVANGFATLDAEAKIPASQLPSFVDDVIEGYLYNGKFYQDAAHTIEITAVSGKIYVNLTDSKTYRWSGTQYSEISSSLALGETSSTAYRGDRGKTAYSHSQVSGDSTIHHTHSNKAELDKVTEGKVEAWDGKIDKTSIATSWGTTASDDKVPSEKLVKSALDGKQATVSFDGTYNASSNKAATVKTVTDKIGALDATITSTDGTNVQVKVTETDGKITAVNIATDNTENKNNKKTAWQKTPSDTAYPSEKLVKTSLDAKVDSSAIATSWGTAASDDKVPSEKLVKAALDGKQASGDYKTTQSAKSDPTESGTSATFIATITQNANGEITATKKTVRSASGSQTGLMSKEHYSKLEGVSAGAKKVEASTTNGNIKIDETETTVYTHPSFTAATAAAKKVGMDAQGHVVLGSALAKGDVGLGNVENKSSATIRSEITSKNVTDALGFTPMNGTVGLSVGNDDDGYYVELS